VSGGVNLLKSKKSFLQISGGARALHTYFFKHYSEESTESGSRFGGFERNRWYDSDFSTFVSIGYHRALLNELNRKHSLSFRVAWDFEYQFPAYYGTTPDGLPNEFASFRTGPSVSLIWRIKRPKNRGLF
jgi:hypothetical protein